MSLKQAQESIANLTAFLGRPVFYSLWQTKELPEVDELILQNKAG